MNDKQLLDKSREVVDNLGRTILTISVLLSLIEIGFEAGMRFATDNRQTSFGE